MFHSDSVLVTPCCINVNLLALMCSVESLVARELVFAYCDLFKLDLCNIKITAYLA